MLFLIGGGRGYQKYSNHSDDHYSNIAKTNGFSGVIVSDANERSKYIKFDLELKEALVDGSLERVAGKIHLYLKKDSSSNLSLTYGDSVLVSGSFYEVPGPDNPFEFDYKKYLAQKNIYSHAFIKSNHIKILGSSPPNPVLGFAYKLRSRAASIIDKNIVSPRENGIAKALLIGIKDHLDNDIRRSYASAGAMHVLAVSGLHVGIVYMFLQFLFGHLKSTAAGRKIFGISSIIIIWLYATIAGLSPSVLRAATMFSIVTVSQMRSIEGNIYNTLGFSAFILLLFDPYLIYSVGFQLSFVAVFGIVYLQPRIYRMCSFDNWILDKIWAITCVSMAAQLATFPLSAYYFHQFPTYFLISNLVVIPATVIILVAGLVMLLVSPWAGLLGRHIGFLLAKVIWLINESIASVERLPASAIQWIYIDQQALILIYGVILTLIWALHHRSFKTLTISALFLMTLAGWIFKSTLNQSVRHQLIFYEGKGKTLIDHIKGHHAMLYMDTLLDKELELLSSQINPNRRASRLNPISNAFQTFNESDHFQTFDAFTHGIIGSKSITIIDSTTFHLQFKEMITTDILMIENESVKSIAWLIKHFSFKELVIGNKNSHFYSKRIRKQAETLGIKIHSLKEDGALILEI